MEHLFPLDFSNTLHLLNCTTSPGHVFKWQFQTSQMCVKNMKCASFDVGKGALRTNDNLPDNLMLVLWHFFNRHTETNKITQLDIRGLEITGDTFMFLIFPLFYLLLKDVYSKMTQRVIICVERWAKTWTWVKFKMESRKRGREGVSKQLFNSQDWNCVLFMTAHQYINIIIIWFISSKRHTFLRKEQKKTSQWS